MTNAVFVGMAGKITKLAAGVMMTHFHRSKVDGALLADVAREVNAPQAVIDAATATETARHFFEVCVQHRCIEPLTALCQRARAECEAHVQGALQVHVAMVDYDGTQVIARSDV
jgi:cobalt-precorrin-5B (C1)-methyltransferase